MHTEEQLNKIKRAKMLALTGYLGLVILTPLWHFLLAPPMSGLSPVFLVLLWGIPLLIPMRGLLKGDAYTFAWANFIAMLYFLHSLTLLYASPDERYLAIIEFILVSLWFGAGTYYARWQGQYLGIGIKKRKKKS
ncbi:DUF2069 domain-containing protein [Gayadomonas joobiniege]|uniref:DUF2069 domain-containing protein n=1 Tax=Gayadomonas joobiniege TaxID=1234606 RepID=UPI00036A5DA8|nr:DUF2069 domain-containing protein [Gayadomonas joobiniege]